MQTWELRYSLYTSSLDITWVHVYTYIIYSGPVTGQLSMEAKAAFSHESEPAAGDTKSVKQCMSAV